MAEENNTAQNVGGQQNGDSTNLDNPQRMAAEMAKAFQELAKGEQTASALERQLDGIESRIDRLLAQAEEAANGTEVQDRVNGFPDNGTGRSSTK
ncbi:hypothetical protein H2198_005603 [Neophaeococcomyces mojaviensis]|uniref:Uncharacterized protein n=1 Tax=Neophaeococcomyces mojaviensis TaxID=3383035 RepID=A0ACC3A5N4_9EURO|nr:hypothetical protein H2198_005603 [Knufia sp. JES_112]